MKKGVWVYRFFVILLCTIILNTVVIGSAQVQAVASRSSKKKPVKVLLPKKTTVIKKFVADKILSINDINNDILKDEQYDLPKAIIAKMSSGKEKEVSVKWNNNVVNNKSPGTYKFIGKVNGYGKKVVLTLSVKEIIYINDLDDITDKNENIKPPNAVVASLNDGGIKAVDVTWDLTNVEKPEPGIYVYYGTVKGYEKKVKYTLDKKIPDKVQEILNKIIKPGMNDYEKELAIHDYLISNTIYDEDYTANRDKFYDYGIIVDGRGTDYNQAFNRLINQAGIEAKIIDGEIDVDGEWYNTSWNLVKLDGEYYHVDALGDYVKTSNGGYITYNYFNLSDNDIKKDHRWSEAEYPVCTSEKYDINNMRENEVNNKVNQIIPTIIKPGMTDVEKEIAIHDYVIQNTIYDSVTLDKSNKKEIYNDSDTNTAYAVLIKGKSMCVGYAEAVNKLLNAVGIESIIVLGDSMDSKGEWQGHAWNLVKLDGDYYHLDATWDDPTFENGNQILRYDYFNMSDVLISKNHKWDTSKYPSAKSNKYSPLNLSLSEKDAQGNNIVCITNVDQLYSFLSDALRKKQANVLIKILSYSTEYDNIIKRTLNESNASRYDGSYYDNDFGARYLIINYTY